MRPRKIILCVDSNEPALSVLRFTLETRGYRVVPMTTADEALFYLECAVPGSVDLLLSELVLYDMDGNELVKQAKRLHPELRTLLILDTLSGSDRAIASDAFLPKGSGSMEILDTIRVLVTRKRGPKAKVKDVRTELREAA